MVMWALAALMNGYQYRLAVSHPCSASAKS